MRSQKKIEKYVKSLSERNFGSLKIEGKLNKKIAIPWENGKTMRSDLKEMDILESLKPTLD